MATVVNDRDVLIMAAVPRFAAPTDRGFFVNPEQAIFKVTNGIASPSSFNFTPTLLNVAGAVSYVPSAGLAIAVSGNNFSLDYSNMTAATGTVTATLLFEGVTYTRTINVSKVVDGIALKILDLAASSQVFKVDKAGVGSPGSIELIAYGQNLNGTPNFTIFAGTATLAIGSDNTRKQLTFANMSTDLVTVQVTQDGQTDTMTIVKVREGADGANAVTGFLTNEAQTVPANLDGSVISMTGATTGMKVFVGLADDTANWTYTGSPASSANAITYTLGALSGVLTASALNAGVDAAYVDVTATRPGYPSVTKRFSLAKSKTGPMGQTGPAGQAGTRGNVNLSVITSGSAWSDTEANAAVSNMTGTAARSRDVVNLYRADRTWAQKRIFDGFNWSILADAFDGSILVKGSVFADSIDARGLSIKDIYGNIILSAASSLAQQVSGNANLVPRVSDWPVAYRYNGAGLFTNTADSLPLNGEYIVIRAGSGYVGYESDALRIPVNTWYTVSFDAFAPTAGSALCVDLFGNVIDTPGLIFSPTPVPQRFSFSEQMTDADAPNARLRVWASGPPSTAYVTNVKVEFGKRPTPWTDDVITPTSASQRVIKGSIIDTMIGGNLQSTNWNGIVGLLGAGWMLERATGNLYCNNIQMRGAVSGGDITSFAWPTGGQGKNGCYFGPEGILIGNANDGKYFQANRNGNIYAPGLVLENGQLTLTNTVLIAPKIGANMTASISPAQYVSQRANNQQFTNVYAGGFTASAGNTSGNLSYTWSISTDNSQITANLNVTTGSQVVVYVTGRGVSGDEFEVTVMCTVLDKDNGVSRTAQAFSIIQVP